MSEQFKDAHAKALAVNLDPTSFGSFAEIGGGQEVARWFLTVGAASGTVAKTISAYDKIFSDAIYGAGTRYVSRERLVDMLDHEYKLLVERLGADRGDKTRFFVFADTVATRNYKGDNDQHGWVGLRFQTAPRSEPSDILLHVNLFDQSASEQQNALGLLGVNLLYGAYFENQTPDQFLECLFQGLSNRRMEIDVLAFNGPLFAKQDSATWNLKLLQRKMARAIVFDRDGSVAEPASILRKRPLVVDRGRFETIEPFHHEMLESAERALRAEGKPLVKDPLAVLELAIRPFSEADAPAVEDAVILSRIKEMLRLGPALITDLPEGFRLVPYFRRYTSEPIRLVGGVTQLARLLQEQFYQNLPGTLLEGLGKLFASNVSYYVYPMPREAVIAAIGQEAAAKIGILGSPLKLIGADDLTVPSPHKHLYQYLRETGRVVPIQAST